MMDGSIARDFINTQNRVKETIIKVYSEGSVGYQEGSPVFGKDGSDISRSIDKLINMDVLDYDEYNNILLLTENYEKHLSIVSDTNIAEIDKKIKNISKLIRDIKQRKESHESYNRESRQISSNLRNVKKTITSNITNLKSIQLRFKGEQNILVRKNNLVECKDELEALSKSLKRLNSFLKKNSLYLFSEIDNESVKHEINSLKTTIINASANIVEVLNELTRYLNQIELEVKKIEHINLIYKLKHSGEILDKTNIREIVDKKHHISKKRKIKRLYRNDEELREFVRECSDASLENVAGFKDKKIEKPDSLPSIIDKKASIKKTISAKLAYTKYTKDTSDKDLATFISELDIDRKKFIALFARIVMSFDSFLEISNKDKIIVLNYKIPTVRKRTRA